MPRNADEDWPCQTCSQHFSSDKELREHIESFQSRALHLFAELQKCFAHSDLELPDEEDGEASDNDDCDGRDLVNGSCEKFLCPHPECEGKPRTEFKEWKYFVRHYAIHVSCHETCAFCGNNIYRVRKYVTHIDNCKARKGQRGHRFLSKQRKAIEQRRILCKMGSKQLELKMSTKANTLYEEGSPQELSDGPTREIAQPAPVQTGELVTQPMSGQYTSRMTQLLSLQQMALSSLSSNCQSHVWGYRQDLTTDNGYNSTFINEQLQRPFVYEGVHHSSRQYEQQNPTAKGFLPPSRENREMKDMYTNAPASNILKLPEPFKTAIENSQLWKWERSKGLMTTGCWPSLFPKDQTQDVSFTIWCGNEYGEHLTDFFGAQLEMSS